MSEELHFVDVLNSLNNANHHLSMLELDEFSEKVQDLIEEVRKEKSKRFEE